MPVTASTAIAKLALALACVMPVAASAAEDPVAGTLTSVGSDTASTLVTRWASAFTELHPLARVQIQAVGSASAPTALLEGAADLGSMSRPMSEVELATFQARYGYPPTRLVVARDAIAVFVHPSNPQRRISLAQLDAIYSSSRRCGAAVSVRTWKNGDDMGGAAPSILAIGRNQASGTFEVFRETALCGGDYRPEIIAWPGSGAVVATVAEHRSAIGYSGVGYVNGLVKVLAIARDDGDAGTLPDSASVTAGTYPLSRDLYLYLNRRPQHRLARLPSAFIDFALSDAGQALVVQEGFLPLAADERAVQRATLVE